MAFFILHSGVAKSGALRVRVIGEASEPGRRNPYEVVGLKALEGNPPAPGPLYLLRSAVEFADHNDLSPDFVTPTIGPLFTSRIPAGATLTDVKPLARFRGKIKGYLGQGFENEESIAAVDWTFFEAEVVRP
jgi:hypothetical protein